MSPERFLEEMREMLRDERNAIRRLDVTAVVAASERKEALMKLVKEASDAERPALVMALGQVREDLKRNLVLLAHARDLVRDSVTRQRARIASLPPGARMSIKL